MDLSVVNQGDAWIVLGWDPAEITGVVQGYRYYVDGSPVARTFRAGEKQVKFAKLKPDGTPVGEYRVVPLTEDQPDVGVYTVSGPPPPPPPPPPPSDKATWGYRPNADQLVSEGWTLVENESPGEVINEQKLYFRNCGGIWLSSGGGWNTDIVIVDSDLTGGFGKAGDNIEVYGCLMGDRDDGDAIQLAGVNGRQSKNWTIQGCTIRNITTPGALHPDGMEIYGLNGLVVRFNYFNNIAVETILCQPYQANDQNNNNILIEKNYFGPDHAWGGTTDVKIADTSGGSWNEGPVRVREMYGGSVAVYPLSAANGDCTADAPLPRSAWPYPLLRPDGWLDY